MTKTSYQETGDSVPTSSTHEEVEDAVSHPFGTLSQNEEADRVHDFITSFNLQHKTDLFRKASTIFQNDTSADSPDLTADEVAALQNETNHKWRQPKLLYFTILTCSMGAIEQGWAQTSMNGANLTFPQALGIGSSSRHDIFIVGLINSGLYLSVGLWGAWLSEPLNNVLGRRGAIFIGSAMCLVANLGSALSWNWQSLLFFRLLLGTGLGIDASTVSVFAAECAPATIRGGLAVSWQMFTAFGIFLGFMANLAFYNYGDDTWRWQLVAPFIPTVPLMIMLIFCPESPAWYMKKNRYQKAFHSACRLRNTELQAAKEILASHVQRRMRTKSTATTSSYLRKVVELFTVPRIRHATMAAYTVMLSQQLCGINIIAFYSSTIFSDAGFSMFGALVASCVFGFVNFIGAFPAIWTMDTLGRRSLLLWTLPPMALTLLLTGLSFRLPQGNLQFGLLATLIYLFCAEYSPGMGPVPCAYSAEVFPLTHREVGMSFAVATANFWAAILSLTFPGLLAGFGSEGSFELYAALNVLALMLVFLFVRETKQKTLDELDEVFALDAGDYIRSTVTEQLPWYWKRYILRRKDVASPPVVGRGRIGYRELGQEEGED